MGKYKLLVKKVECECFSNLEFHSVQVGYGSTLLSVKDFWRVISACLWRRQKLPKSSTTSKTHNHSCPRVQCYEALYSTSACPRVQYYGPCTVQGMTEKKFSEMFSFSLAQLLQLRFTCPEFILIRSCPDCFLVCHFSLIVNDKRQLSSDKLEILYCEVTF